MIGLECTFRLGPRDPKTTDRSLGTRQDFYYNTTMNKYRKKTSACIAFNLLLCTSKEAPTSIFWERRLRSLKKKITEKKIAWMNSHKSCYQFTNLTILPFETTSLRLESADELSCIFASPSSMSGACASWVRGILSFSDGRLAERASPFRLRSNPVFAILITGLLSSSWHFNCSAVFLGLQAL